MKLKEVTVKNFRCLNKVTVPIGEITVLVGENNSGKTAFLDALKLVLSRSQPRYLAFDEYDYHMAKAGDSPQSCGGILIELLFQEGVPDEWPAPLTQALDPIIQTDPVKDIDSISLRVTSSFDEIAKEMRVKWEFLDLSGKPLAGKGAASGNVLALLSYVRLFYMAALRDCAEEFSPRSQFWGRILKDLKFGAEQRKVLQDELGKLNTSLLAADPRLEQVRDSIENIHDILSVATGQSVSIQALPLQPWDLMSKAQLVVKPRGSQVDFPLSRHGQGMQSLAVMFLFQAYIDILLKPSFEPETEALLALEEPEAHLHPHAARAFARSLGQLKSQKIVSSHSPYFIQEIPFKAIRMFRRNGATTKVLYVRDTFSTQVPIVTGLADFCSRSGGKFEYNTGRQELSVHGKVEQNEYRTLLTLYANSRETHATLKKLSEESQLFLTDAELADLETYAKRIRGEVLFARAWLLCEGQSEYLLVRYFAELLGKRLDQCGISVIDFQNNGSPGTFVGLARAFEIPWMMFCDNDAEGLKFSNQVQERGVTGTELEARVRPLPGAGMDLETFLAKNGFLQEYEEIATARGWPISTKRADAGHEEEVAKAVKGDKTGTMLRLLEKLLGKGMAATGIPVFFKTLIDDLTKEVS